MCGERKGWQKLGISGMGPRADCMAGVRDGDSTGVPWPFSLALCHSLDTTNFIKSPIHEYGTHGNEKGVPYSLLLKERGRAGGKACGGADDAPWSCFHIQC